MIYCQLSVILAVKIPMKGYFRRSFRVISCYDYWKGVQTSMLFGKKASNDEVKFAAKVYNQL